MSRGDVPFNVLDPIFHSCHDMSRSVSPFFVYSYARKRAPDAGKVLNRAGPNPLYRVAMPEINKPNAYYNFIDTIILPLLI